MSQATGQPKFPIYAESETKFFPKTFDAEIQFSGDHLTLHQGGHDITGKRK